MAHAEVADIFRRYGPSYRDTHKLPLTHLRTMHAIDLQDRHIRGTRRRMRGVRPYQDILQLVQEQALPEVSVFEEREVSRGTAEGTPPHPVLSRGLYLTGRDQSPCLEKQRGRLQHLVQGGLRDAHGTREETSQCEDWLHRRPSHVGTEPHGPSSPPLHRLGRRPVTGEVDLLEKEVPLPREDHVLVVQRQVPRKCRVYCYAEPAAREPR